MRNEVLQTLSQGWEITKLIEFSVLISMKNAEENFQQRLMGI